MAAGAQRGRGPVERQVSAGGVAFRTGGAGVEVALIAVGEPRRWQLPKGRVDPGETAEQAASREVREEAGLETERLGPLDTIEYWYQVSRDGGRVRIHKRVHFFLMRATGGDVSRHDQEVHEARWFPIAEAIARLAFPGERRVVEKARALIEQALAAVTAP